MYNPFQSMKEEMVPLFMDLMLQAELSGDKSKVYKSSLATISDSGLSFGRCQFDVKNNSTAVKILSDLGFDQSEIAAIKNIKSLSDPLVKAVDAKLASPQGRTLIDQYDSKRAEWCIDNVLDIFDKPDDLFHMEQVFHLADMANQYGRFTNPGTTRTWFDGKKFHLTKDIDVWAEAFKQMKLNHTKHGRQFPFDVERRFREIRNFFKRI